MAFMTNVTTLLRTSSCLGKNKHFYYVRLMVWITFKRVIKLFNVSLCVSIPAVDDSIKNLCKSR